MFPWQPQWVDRLSIRLRRRKRETRREKWLPLLLATAASTPPNAKRAQRSRRMRRSGRRRQNLPGVRGRGCGRRATMCGRRAQPATASTREQWLRCSSYRSDGMLQQPSGGSPAVEEAQGRAGLASGVGRGGTHGGAARRAAGRATPRRASTATAARVWQGGCIVAGRGHTELPSPMLVRAPWRRRRVRPRGAAGSQAWRGGARPHATARGQRCQGRAGRRRLGGAGMQLGWSKARLLLTPFFWHASKR